MSTAPAESSVQPTPGFGILGRHPVISVLVFAITGIAVGVWLSTWEPEDDDEEDRKGYVLQWFGLIGDLFIRALKCIVLPLVFINVAISVVDMMSLGRASSIGWSTIGLYLLTTIVASIIGIFSIMSFKPLFKTEELDSDDTPYVTLGCNADGSYLTEQDDGSIVCSADGDKDSIRFVIDDVSGTFAKSSSGPKDDISLSDTIYDGIFTKIVTSNIFVSFYSGNFAAVVFFAIAFGAALSRVLNRLGRSDEGSAVMAFFKELDGVFLTLINWVIMFTPFAVFSLIVKAVGKQEDLADAFENVSYLVVATIIAMLAHFLIMHLGFFFLMTRSNPIAYWLNIIPAETMAFACASSAATIPVTLSSVASTGRVPDAVARFVVPLGATINMDGGAIYFPCACIWLAVLNGLDIDAASYVLLVIISTIGSAGTAPVPSASLVLIITAYNTVFNQSGTPDGFSFILAIDWFMDRLRTTLNVTGDAFVAGVVAARNPVEDIKGLEDEVMEEAPLETVKDEPVTAQVE